MTGAATLNVVLSLALTSELGLEGPAVATATAFALAFPFLLRLGLGAAGSGSASWRGRHGCRPTRWARCSPARWWRCGWPLEPSGLPAVTAAGVVGVGGYWLAYYALFLDPGERALVRGLTRARLGFAPWTSPCSQPRSSRTASGSPTRLTEVAASGRYILGPEVEAFEREFADYLGVRHAMGVGNGTDALTIALRALGVAPGDEVVCPSFTFYATAEAWSTPARGRSSATSTRTPAASRAATVKPRADARARGRSCRCTCSATSPRCRS